jgi:hypothetical protein
MSNCGPLTLTCSITKLPRTMDETCIESDHTLKKESESGSSVTPASTADFPDKVTILVLADLSGTCTVISNKDLSLVDPSEIPRPTLELIRLAEELSRETRAEVLEKFPADRYNDIRQTREFEALSNRKLRPAFSQAKAASSQGIVHGGVLCRRVLDLFLNGKPPEWTLVIDGPRGFTSGARSVETAYNAYLASRADEKREGSEGLEAERGVDAVMSEESRMSVVSASTSEFD